MLGFTHMKEVMSTCSLLWLHFQGKIQEVLEHSRQVVLIFDLWCAVFGNKIECS